MFLDLSSTCASVVDYDTVFVLLCVSLTEM